MRWMACIVLSSGAMKSAAYPAKKISAAAKTVDAIRPFIGCVSSFLD
jgi:hypothetical protein